MNTKHSWRSYLIALIWIICVEGWTICGTALIAYMNRTGVTQRSTGFGDNGDYLGYLFGGIVGLFMLSIVGIRAIDAATKRENVRQRWLRRYAHRPLRPRPLV